MEENQLLADLINKDWGTPDDSLPVVAGSFDREFIRQKLAIIIANMIHNDFEKLCQAMYRLDVSESKFHKVLTETPSEKISISIADLVIERELQKVRTRIMYKQKKL